MGLLASAVVRHSRRIGHSMIEFEIDVFALQQFSGFLSLRHKGLLAAGMQAAGFRV